MPAHGPFKFRLQCYPNIDATRNEFRGVDQLRDGEIHVTRTRGIVPVSS